MARPLEVWIYIYRAKHIKTYVGFLDACAVGVRSGGTAGWVRGTMGGAVGTVLWWICGGFCGGTHLQSPYSHL